MSKTDYYAIQGLPQRQTMCHDCPAKAGHDIHSLRAATPHICHNAQKSICAGNLSNSNSGRKKLFRQLEGNL